MVRSKKDNRGFNGSSGNKDLKGVYVNVWKGCGRDEWRKER